MIPALARITAVALTFFGTATAASTFTFTTAAIGSNGVEYSFGDDFFYRVRTTGPIGPRTIDLEVTGTNHPGSYNSAYADASMVGSDMAFNFSFQTGSVLSASASHWSLATNGSFFDIHGAFSQAGIAYTSLFSGNFATATELTRPTGSDPISLDRPVLLNLTPTAAGQTFLSYFLGVPATISSARLELLILNADVPNVTLFTSTGANFVVAQVKLDATAQTPEPGTFACVAGASLILLGWCHRKVRV